MGARHNNFETELAGRKGVRFLTDFFRAVTGDSLRPGASVIAMPEFGYQPAVKPPGNTSGKMWLDVFFIILGRRDRDITVGVEVKVTQDDLLFGEKLHYELGVADYLFLAVPRDLIPAARYVIQDQLPEDVPRIGLVDLNSGDVVIIPNKSQIICKMENLYRMALLRNSVRLDFNSLTADNPEPEFHLNGLLNVNRKYDGLLAVPFTPKVPAHGKCYERFRACRRFQALVTTQSARAGPVIAAGSARYSS